MALVMPIAFDLDLFYIAPFYHRYAQNLIVEKSKKMSGRYKSELHTGMSIMGKCLP